jgi:DNA repair protein RecN (Recombination protein N)
MLTELRVRNLAVIEELSIGLGPGLTVLTGETGAGKSIVVGALSLLLGERAQSEAIRSGEDSALVEGTFDVAGQPEIAAVCEEAGIDAADGWLVLRRQIQREGRNRVWINSSPATARLVAEIGERLVDLHGQHEHQALLRAGAQRSLLDAFAGAGELAGRVSSLWRSLTETRRLAAESRRGAARAREREDYLRHKVREIESAKLQPGEEDALAAEARRLESSEQLLALSSEVHELAYAADGALVDGLARLRRPLAELARIDPASAELLELLESSLRSVEELGRRAGEYHERVEHDPERLRVVRERLDLLYRLRSKYGGTTEVVRAEGEAARAELDGLEASGEQAGELERQAAELEAEHAAACAELGRARREGAVRLTAAVERELPVLGLAGGRFVVHLEPLDTPSSTGAERVEFRVSLNPGFEPGPLARIASGGEISRLMLALKSALAGVDDIPCLVFDEIDAGVGGTVAREVAIRLAAIARRHQVLVITHLPQIAVLADSHLQVEKAVGAGKATTVVSPLAGEARVDEVARMLGDPDGEAARRHAQELLKLSAGTEGLPEIGVSAKTP